VPLDFTGRVYARSVLWAIGRFSPPEISQMGTKITNKAYLQASRVFEVLMSVIILDRNLQGRFHQPVLVWMFKAGRSISIYEPAVRIIRNSFVDYETLTKSGSHSESLRDIRTGGCIIIVRQHRASYIL
jgi:hypothetical protein